MLILKTNEGTSVDVEIPDLGFVVPFGGGQIILTTREEIEDALNSDALRLLCLDNAYSGTSSIILNDGTSDIALVNVENFLKVANLPISGGYSIPIRDANGNDTVGGIGNHETLDTLAHFVVENSHEELTYSGNKITSSVLWTDSNKVTKIRETFVSYSGNKIIESIDIQYDGSGTEIYRVTSNFTYSGSRIVNIQMVRT